jgi:hypothetical protein
MPLRSSWPYAHVLELDVAVCAIMWLLDNAASRFKSSIELQAMRFDKKRAAFGERGMHPTVGPTDEVSKNQEAP